MEIRYKLYPYPVLAYYSNDFNQQNMVVLAQRLINDPLTEAFKVLCDGFGTTGGDEE